MNKTWFYRYGLIKGAYLNIKIPIQNWCQRAKWFYYKIRYKYQVHLPFLTSLEYLEEIYHIPHDNKGQWYFANEEDAILFKLTWEWRE